MRKARLPDEKLKSRLKLIGLRIAYYRKHQKLTQEALAERLGYSASYLARIEASGDNDNVVPTLDFLYLVADTLGIPITKLLEEEPDHII